MIVMRQRAVPNRNRGRNNAGKAAFLAAGLMLASACGSSARNHPPDASVQDKGNSDGACLKLKKDTKIHTIREGDEVAAFRYPYSSGYIGLKVYRIDDDGVLLSTTTDVFMSEHESDPWRVDYGEERKIGEFVLNFSVRAERGQETKAAQLTVTTTALSE